MPFSTGGSLTSTDANNMLRGLYRDNADHAVTGTVAETDMASTSITANTIGATGTLLLVANGTITGTAGTKTIRFYLGSTAIATLTRGAAFTVDWGVILMIHNTASNAQRLITLYTGPDVVATSMSYGTAAVDTTANQTFKVTGQLSNTGDTITGKTFDVFVAQIT